MNPPKLTDALTDADQGAAASDTRFFGHPRGLATLFFTEMWERFSYYGMRAFLLYYMTASAAAGGLGFTDAQGASAYGTYTGSAWGASIVGGLIADRFLGQYRSVLWGGVLIMLAHLSLVFPPVPFFYAGLGRDKETLPSALIGKPAPVFELPSVEDPSRTVSNSRPTGRWPV